MSVPENDVVAGNSRFSAEVNEKNDLLRGSQEIYKIPSRDRALNPSTKCRESARYGIAPSHMIRGALTKMQKYLMRGNFFCGTFFFEHAFPERFFASGFGDLPRARLPIVDNTFCRQPTRHRH